MGFNYSGRLLQGKTRRYQEVKAETGYNPHLNIYIARSAGKQPVILNHRCTIGRGRGYRQVKQRDWNYHALRQCFNGGSYHKDNWLVRSIHLQNPAFGMIGKADIERSTSNMAKNTWRAHRNRGRELGLDVLKKVSFTLM